MANPDTKLLQEGKIYSFYCNQRHTLHPYSERPRKELERKKKDKQRDQNVNIQTKQRKTKDIQKGLEVKAFKQTKERRNMN